MFALKLAFLVHLLVAAEVPVDVSAHTWEAARAQGVDPYDLAAFLISEHSGPDFDFSVQTALASGGYGVTYDLDSVGSAGELGVYQQEPYWVRKASKALKTEWTKEDLLDLEVNTKVAAYQLWHAQDKHARACGKDSLHTWVAHLKCARKARNQVKGQCRYAQRKYEKLRYSLGAVLTPDLRAVGSEHNKRVRELVRKDEKRRRKGLVKQARKLYAELGVSDDALPHELIDSLTVPELVELVRNLEAEAGYFDPPPWATEGD